MKPTYEHDCEECVFLGRMEESLSIFPDFVPNDQTWDQVFSTNAKKDIDLYYCEKQRTRPTVIARLSADPGDYLSGLQFADEATCPPLKAAKNLAIAKGLLDG